MLLNGFSILPVPRNTEVSVLHNGVKVGDTEVHPLQVRQGLFQKPLTAVHHLYTGNAGLLVKLLQRKFLP